jgi:hypothetical protein
MPAGAVMKKYTRPTNQRSENSTRVMTRRYRQVVYVEEPDRLERHSDLPETTLTGRVNHAAALAGATASAGVGNTGRGNERK